MGVFKTGLGSLAGIAFGATVALADQHDTSPSLIINEPTDTPTLQIGPTGNIDTYVLESTNNAGHMTQRRGIHDKEAGIVCEYEVTGIHKVGIVGTSWNADIPLHGVTMPVGSRFADTSNVKSSLSCERADSVPEEWLGTEEAPNPVEQLTDRFADSVAHVFESGNSAVLFIQSSANDTARTVYARENIAGTEEFTVSVAQMIDPASTRLDFMFVNGERLDSEEDAGFQPLAEAASYSFE